MTALWFWAVDAPAPDDPPAPEPVVRVLRYPATPQTVALVAYEARVRQQQRVSNVELAEARGELDRRARDENRLRQLQLRQLERLAQQEHEQQAQQERERQAQQERRQQANEQQTAEPASKQTEPRGTPPRYDRDQIKAEIRNRPKPTAPEMVEWCKDNDLKAPSERHMARYIADIRKEKTKPMELP